MHAAHEAPDLTRARREYHLLLALNAAIALSLAAAVLHFIVLAPGGTANLARLTRGGPLWTGLLAASLLLGWADVLIAPTLRVRRELKAVPEPVSWEWTRRAS